ncbi:hypothetical protein [Clostridium tarantellae]|uniref:Twitching motility protein PilT n=1 Tax=Clostridium tarantellae TaxID=39493 RepID=A0A6I1MJM5_9CLOT|nr:hypothetical protein [Clostridium tarantellae]MPQ43726.1 hypothetical protein [Clostridium tarantellae]
MIQVFFSERGSGKSKNLISLANEKALNCKGNLVYIDDDNKRMLHLNKKIRFISMDDFKLESYEQVYGFLCGIISRDFDIENIYLDGVCNLTTNMESEEASRYFNKLEKLTKKFCVNVFINLHQQSDKLPEYIKKYVA